MNSIRYNLNWQTKVRGTNEDEYDIYLYCANDGNGGDITRQDANGDNLPLKTYEEWIRS